METTAIVGPFRRWVVALLCVMAASTAAHGAALVSVATSPGVPTQGHPFSLDVNISGVDDLFAFQFDLLFNPNVLRGQNVSEGSFLGSGGATFFVPGTIDNAAGSIQTIADSLVGFVSGVSGGGLLMTVGFDALDVGTSPIGFANALFLDSTLADITSEVSLLGGTVTVAARGTSVAEPSSVLLLAMAFAGIAFARRQRVAARP